MQCANGAPEDGLRLPWLLLEFSYFSGFNHPRQRPCFLIALMPFKGHHSESAGAHAMDVQVGELVRRYWAPWEHGPGPAAERVSAGDPRAFGLPSAGLVLLGPNF